MKIAVILEKGEIQAIYSGDPENTQIAVYDLDAIRAGQAPPAGFDFVVHPLGNASLGALTAQWRGDLLGPGMRASLGPPMPPLGGMRASSKCRPRKPSPRPERRPSVLWESGAGSSRGGSGGAPRPTVVLVEDSPVLRRLYNEMLLLMQCRPVLFERGGPCLDYLRKHEPRMLIVDILLPDIDGIELIERARPMLAPETPVVCLTNIESPEMEAFIRKAGASDILHKTQGFSVIQARLEEWLSGRAGP